MLITRTPVRVSFCGGGTDLPAFYENHPDGGLVTSVGLSAYIYVTVNQRFDDSVRVSYSKTEIVDNFEDLEHELVREAMRLTGVISGIEITTIADIPGKGTGLGSSSAVTVGLLHALHRFAGTEVDAARLAEEACHIEMEVLNQTLGKQDQYAAAYGGLNRISFAADGTVSVEPVDIDLSEFSSSFCLVYTGQTRQAEAILKKQSEGTASKMDRLIAMRAQAEQVSELIQANDLGTIGSLLGEAWALKKELASGITNEGIDELYERLMDLGCTGGKLLGAGGGGFILVQTPPGVQTKISETLPNKVIPLLPDLAGSTLLLDDRED